MSENLMNSQQDQELHEENATIVTSEHDAAAEEVQQTEDFTGWDKTQLLNRMKECLTSSDLDSVRGTVAKLKELFRELAREEMEAKRRQWEENKEGADDTFEPAPDAVVEEFEESLRKYNQQRADQRRQREVEQNRNLQKKLELIDELKALAETSDSMNKAFEKLQDLQARWREVGQVPSARVNELRNTWQHHQDRFFDMVKISRELRELDHKKNQELKEELIVKAEELDREASVRRALDVLHELHESWKEIGPAAKDINEQLWERFKAASDKVHDRKKVLLEDAKVKQLENLELKRALCVKMEEEATHDYQSHKDWQTATERADAIFEEWKKIGFVPKEDEDQTWKCFRDARLQLFKKRETFYGKQREVFDANLKLKIELCEKAEALTTSTDWKNTANQLKKLQDDWKKVGPVPRKQSDKVWNRFKKAADTFFDNRSKHFAEKDAEFAANAAVREGIIAEAGATALPDDLVEARKVIAALQEKWSQAPMSPRNERERLDNAWKTAMDGLFDKLREKGGDEKTMQRIRVEQLSQTDKGRDQLRRERGAIQEKIKKLESEINTLETNLGFFGKSKGAQSMVAEYQQKVDKAKEEVAALRVQLKAIPRD
jgi:hypothetical protein